MDPVRNPFAPGAGSPPPLLAGRDTIRQKIQLCLSRLRIGRPSKSMVLIGLRGVGKTVLMDQMMRDAEAQSVVAVHIEAPEGRSLPALLAPQLRLALLRLSQIEKATDRAIRGLKALAGFAVKLKLVFNDIEVGLDYAPEPGLADNGDLEGDLTMLLEQVGLAAQAAETVVAIFIDELQFVEIPQLAALVTALHRCAQKQLPLILIGAGLPQLRGKLGNAKSYSERLFDFMPIGALTASEASEAIVQPIHDEHGDIDGQAVALIVDVTKGYPYFLQEWGKHAWDVALQSPITVADVNAASKEVFAHLDESFFRVRFDRLTPKERQYLRAMSHLGAGPHRSGDIAATLKRDSSSFGPIRSSLIAKGMIWSPTHGDTAFTVALFDEFMLRIMPGQDWSSF